MDKKAYQDKRDENVLLSRLQRGDRVAFSELYNRFADFLLAYAYKVTQDEDEAKDIVQAIFVNLWTNREQLVIHGPFFNYLLKSVRYGFYKSIRHKQVVSKYEDDLRQYLREERDTTDEYIQEKELMQRLERLAESFPDTMGKVFVMTYFQQLSPAEIAGQLNISVRTVQNLLSQAGKRARLSIGLALALSILAMQYADSQLNDGKSEKNAHMGVKK